MPRLDHLVARNLSCSRASARELVEDGRLRDAQRIVLTDPKLSIDHERCPIDVELDDCGIKLYDSFHLMLNKPLRFVTALHDDHHPVAQSLIQQAPLSADLRPAGRLDADTTGLLIWTTDGQWLHRLTHPRRQVPRTYQAALARGWRDVPPDFALEDGHRPHITDLRALDAGELHPSLLERPAGALYASITVTGGAYHEIRRIFAALGSHVLALCRVSFGRLALPRDLEPGDWRPVVPDEV